MKTRLYRSLAALTILLILAMELPYPGQAAPPAQGPQPPGLSSETLIAQLQQGTGGTLRIAYHAETGKVSFIGASPDRPISRPAALKMSASTAEAAYGFLATYGKLFGLTDPAGELSVMRERTFDGGRAFVHFQQIYHGVPIVGGELIVHTDASQNILSASGEILPDLDLDTTPSIKVEVARQTALEEVAKEYGVSTSELIASKPEVWIFSPALLGGPGARLSHLVWRTEVTASTLAPIRELVLIDARHGGVVLNFNQFDTALNRRTYTANNTYSLPGTLVCNESNPSCSGGDAHAVAAHRYAGDTYNFYWNYHGRDSINNAGMILTSTIHYGVDYDNAGWTGVQMIYGDAYGFPLADDVVAHELTHGVTQYESNLFYYYQSGAINEAFSDLWGEFVDLTNGAGNDSAAVRWLLGEDISGLGAIRNMQNPPAFEDPDRMTSSYYYTGTGDNGGVHYNSGVNNKAVYLLTDGGTFNGRTVSGLGITKVAKIYYQAQANLLTSGADYADLYNVLYQGCLNLVGTAGITAADCQEVRDATDAVEMNLQPVAGYNTDAPVCTAGQPNNLFFDNLESGTGNWTFGALSGTSRWRYDAPDMDHGPFAHSGAHFLYAYDYPDAISDSYAAMNRSVTLPAGAFLHFAHAYGFEGLAFDGGVLEYSVNSGASWNDTASLFTHNGYDGTVSTSYSNPLGGRSAFLADSHGYISSRLDLASLAGQSVRFRWRMGLDSSGYDVGWWVDDIRLYTCTVGPTPLPPSNLRATPVSSTQINLAWTDNSNNESGFEIERSPNGTSGWARIATVGANITSYNNAGLACNSHYYYRVRAYNTNGNSSYSNVADAATYSSSSCRKILFDETHGYGSSTSGDYIIEDQLSELAALLTGRGATVHSLTAPATFNYAAISQYDVLALVVPQSSYSAQERADIQAFVQNGGRLVVIGEFDLWTPGSIARPILNGILSSLGTGIALNADLVHDPIDYDGSNDFWPIIHEFLTTDPVNQGVGQVVEYAGASLSVSSPGYATAWGDSHTYTDFRALSALKWDANGSLVPSPTPFGPPEGKFFVDGVLSDTPPAPASKIIPGESEPLAGPILQANTLINFDNVSQPCGFSSATALRNEYQAVGVLFNGPGGNNGGAILNECGGFSVNGYSSPNFLAFNTSSTLSNGGMPRGPEEITFVQPVSFVQIKAGSNTSAGQTITMQAFDASNSSLGSKTITLGPTLQPLSISASGIAKVTISSPASVFVLDDLLFGTGGSGSAIPVMAMAGIEGGDAFVVGDLSLWSNSDPDGDGTIDLYEYDNDQLAVNVFLGVQAEPPTTSVFLPLVVK